MRLENKIQERLGKDQFDFRKGKETIIPFAVDMAINCVTKHICDIKNDNLNQVGKFLINIGIYLLFK